MDENCRNWIFTFQTSLVDIDPCQIIERTAQEHNMYKILYMTIRTSKNHSARNHLTKKRSLDTIGGAKKGRFFMLKFAFPDMGSN